MLHTRYESSPTQPPSARPIPRRLLHGLLVALVVLIASPRVHADDPLTIPAQMAIQLHRAAKATIAIEPLTTDLMETAVLLTKRALELAPNDPDVWRTMLYLAEISDDPELTDRAIRKLVELQPDDQVMILRRINLSIEQLQNVDDRIAKYESLLQPQVRTQLGDVLSSQLALDLALLQRSHGNVEEFARRLTQAMQLDRANRTAAALGANFYLENSNDPYGQAEMLTNLMLADPSDLQAQITLASLLLENGAYDGAQKIYKVAIKNFQKQRSEEIGYLLADLVIAQWGAGDVSGALETIKQQQLFANRLFHAAVRRQNPDVDPIELARRDATLAPTLAAVSAALANRQLPPEEAQRRLSLAISSHRNTYDRLTQNAAATDADRARLILSMVWLAVCLDGDLDEAIKALDLADQTSPLTDEARQRFEGWFALRNGDPDLAMQTLEPLIEDDVLSRVGYAMALQQLDQPTEAARQFYRVVREQPGTVIGVWCRDVLNEMLDEPLPQTDLAQDLNALIKSIPDIFHRFPDSPQRMFTVRVEPAKVSFDPFDPVTINIEVINHSPFPLAIHPDGPIRPQIVVLVDATVSNSPQVGGLPPMVVNIDRRLRLDARSSFTIPVDLRRQNGATVFDQSILRGATIRCKVLTNFAITPQGALTTAFLGTETTSDYFRISGIRQTRSFMEDAIAAVAEPDSVEDVETLALLASVVATGPKEDAPEEDLDLFDTAQTVLVEAFAKLQPVEQAWVLSVIPDNPAMEPVLDIARQSEDQLVKLSYLMFRVSRPNDPMLDAAKRGDDETISRMSDLIRSLIIMRREMLRRDNRSPAPPAR